MAQVFVHGLGQTPAAWEPIAGLPELTEPCLCPDLAQLIGEGPADWDRLYSEFEKVCNALPPPIHLCGLSLGGVLALEYTIRHPERVGTLAVIAAPYRMPRHLLQAQNILFRLMPGSAFRGIGFEKAQFLRLCASMRDLDFTADLARIACPALVVCGEKDRANKKACINLSRLLKQGQLRIISGAGHEVNVQAPEKLAEILREFYSRTKETEQLN